MIKAIIYDKDGVLTDSIKLYYHILLKMMGNKKISFSDYYKHCFQEMKSSYIFVSDKMSRKEFSLNIRKLYYDLFDAYFRFFPGAISSVKRLSKDYMTALATSNHRMTVDYEFNNNGYEKYFKKILTGDDIHEDKPDPAIYLAMLDKLKIKNSEAIVIEDTISGQRAAMDAGIRCLIYRTKWRCSNRKDQACSTIGH